MKLTGDAQSEYIRLHRERAKLSWQTQGKEGEELAELLRQIEEYTKQIEAMEAK